MSKERGFMEYDRRDPVYRPAEERIRDYRDVTVDMAAEELRQQTARCMGCGVPFCHSHGCPLGNLIPEFNEHLYYGRRREALDLLMATNPFPEFTGRVCPAPCETSCVLGINAPPVTICQIEKAIIEQGFAAAMLRPTPPPVRRKEHVAVVGSGPAGLSAAAVLNKAGFHVTVYEEAALPGGLLRYGIPDFKLEKWVIDRRLDLMREEGVRFECGIRVGEDLSWRYLSKRYAAIVLCAGARQPRELRVPGRELAGVHQAMDFLTRQNQRISGESSQGPDITATDKAVVIIGGGDTGSDCLGTAIRQGARSVLQFEIMPRPPDERAPHTPWPLWPHKLRTSSSHLEGGTRHWAVNTVRLEGHDGQVTRLHAVEVEWVPSAGEDRPAPHPIAGSEFAVDADLVLLAMGFTGPGGFDFSTVPGIEVNDRGLLRKDADAMTGLPGVFVAGDVSRGASLVVHAMEDGKRAAQGVMRYLG